MRSLDEIVKDIKTVLEEKVAQNVAAHNGAIGFINFASDTGVATLKLSGACSGCAMSQRTLKEGVERLLKHYVPEVNSIVGEDDEQAAEQGYKPFCVYRVEIIVFYLLSCITFSHINPFLFFIFFFLIIFLSRSIPAFMVHVHYNL